MVSRRAQVLLQCFQAVAAAAGGAAFTIDCAQHAATDTPGAGDDAGAAVASMDAALPPGDETGSTAPTGDDASPDVSVEAAPPAPCTSKIDSNDGGPDGEELCIFHLTCGVEQIGFATVGCQVVPTAIDGAPVSDPTSVGFPTCFVNQGEGCLDGSYAPTEAGIVFTCIGCPGGGGRRPAGLVNAPPARASSPLGAYFAEMGRIEAASVRAFADLARKLADHGAPEALVACARASAGDEVRHARVMRRLAGRFQASPGKVEIRARRSRSLVALARENAVEGCVRETFGALVNAWQARCAGDPEVRAEMQTVARDELRHAALAWEIGAWLSPRLTPSERRSVARAQRRAVARLVGEMGEGPSESLRLIAGLPNAAQARALVRGLADRLWS